MPPERIERKLAAILAADVAGYSRLMGADEEGTLARLKACRRELMDPEIAEHRGRVVKTTGDGNRVRQLKQFALGGLGRREWTIFLKFHRACTASAAVM